VVRFKIAGPRSRPVRPVERDIELTLELTKYKDAVRVVAIDANTGERLPDGNLVKIVPNEGVYLYHTINPDLGLPVDRQGRLILLRENPHSTR
jgi:hypothetical protein